MVIDADSIYEKLLFVGFDKLQDWTQITKTQVGADLQYIRINGTIVGALVGCAIYLLSIATT